MPGGWHRFLKKWSPKKNESVLTDRESRIIQSETQKEWMTVYSMRYVHGHVQVYDYRGNFLFSADTEREAREEMKEYAESAA